MKFRLFQPFLQGPLCLVLWGILFYSPLKATPEIPAQSEKASSNQGVKTLTELCIEQLKPFAAVPRRSNLSETQPSKKLRGKSQDSNGNATQSESLKRVCESVSVKESCKSFSGTPIFHYDRNSEQSDSKRVLVIGLIHGDEFPSGVVSRFWMERLQQISPRNSWRVIPVMNPDGVAKKSRMNARGVDLNRNFPTLDWESLATKEWQQKYNSNPRRFPGDTGGSEPETRCALKHIEAFKPHFVVSIHTPLRVLDFDGPKVPTPQFSYLPWRRLGNFPGSLGRYLWVERNVPVLTAEFAQDPPASEPLAHLQDIIGRLSRFEGPNRATAQTGNFSSSDH